MTQITSESSVAAIFGNSIDLETHRKVLDLNDWLLGNPFPGLLSVVPAYTTVTVFFDPVLVKKHWPEQGSPSHAVCAFLEEKIQQTHLLENRESSNAKLTNNQIHNSANNQPVEIPVRYGGKHGADLSEVAARLNLSENEVVRLHTEAVYTVFMVGFLPGFPYLGQLPQALELPRRDTPRLRVPAGSVAIAGQQTGIYPQASPGGWHLIGQPIFHFLTPNNNRLRVCNREIWCGLYKFDIFENSSNLAIIKSTNNQITNLETRNHETIFLLTINILTPGLLTTIQDLGRPEWRSSGVPLGGAMDTFSHRLANLLVGNSGHAASLEITGGGFRAKVAQAGWLALCGAGGQFFIDKKNIGNGRLAFAPEGSELEIRANPSGNFDYLATPGGWDVPVALGSRSTCLSAGFGGFEGRGLRKGDVLSAVDSSGDFKSSGEGHCGKIWVSKWFVGTPTFRKLSTLGKFNAVIRALPGPEFHWWGEAQQRQFFNTSFRVSAQRDRMGLRLEAGASDTASRKLSTFGKFDIFGKFGTMLSTAVAPGTVQMPPDGQPIALLADAQTVGGYPRIAQVIAVDISRLAQIPSGQEIRFQEVALEEAERLFFEQEILLRRIQLTLRFVAPS